MGRTVQDVTEMEKLNVCWLMDGICGEEECVVHAGFVIFRRRNVQVKVMMSEAEGVRVQRWMVLRR